MIVVALNPAVDVTDRVDSLTPGSTNRVTQVLTQARLVDVYLEARRGA